MAEKPASAEKAKLLRLRAEDFEDLMVLAACLQDALAKISEIVYLPGRRRFALALSRYRWEREQAAKGPLRAHERVTCGLHFDNVLAVRARGCDQSAPGTVLELLTIAAEPLAGAEPGTEGGATITLLFAGDAAIQLDVECIDCSLSDITTPWPVSLRPDHGPNLDNLG